MELLPVAGPLRFFPERWEISSPFWFTSAPSLKYLITGVSGLLCCKSICVEEEEEVGGNALGLEKPALFPATRDVWALDSVCSRMLLHRSGFDWGGGDICLPPNWFLRAWKFPLGRLLLTAAAWVSLIRISESDKECCENCCLLICCDWPRVEPCIPPPFLWDRSELIRCSWLDPFPLSLRSLFKRLELLLKEEPGFPADRPRASCRAAILFSSAKWDMICSSVLCALLPCFCRWDKRACSCILAWRNSSTRFLFSCRLSSSWRAMMLRHSMSIGFTPDPWRGHFCCGWCLMPWAEISEMVLSISCCWSTIKACRRCSSRIRWALTSCRSPTMPRLLMLLLLINICGDV